MQEIQPYVSIVIPTFNRSAKLSRCLDSLSNQTYPKDRYEIIVINDGSNDNTEDILREFEKKAPCRFLWFSQKNQGIPVARNSGLSASKGDIICFTDDDCIAENNWIKSLVNGFSDATIGAVGGQIVSFQAITPLQQYFEENKVVNQESFMLHNKLITGNAAYRRRILTDIQGFDNYLTACEDVDVSIKTQLLGFKLNYVPESVIYHDHPDTVKGLLFRSYRNGIGFVRLHKKYGIKYNLAYNTCISGYRIMAIVLRYPFILMTALVSNENNYFILKPLFEVIRSGGFTWGIVQETLWGGEYEGKCILSNVDFIEFMENKSIFSLGPKIKKKIFR